MIILDNNDVELVMYQADIPRETAEETLRRFGGDVVLAIMELMDLNRVNVSQPNGINRIYIRGDDRVINQIFRHNRKPLKDITKSFKNVQSRY